jgi:hypothetical protein
MKIAGSDINIDHADIKGKNIQDLKKLDIFSHLSKEDQEKAYTELYNAIVANVPVTYRSGGNYTGPAKETVIDGDKDK